MDAIVAHAARRTAELGGAKERDRVARLAALWDRAGREVPGWPAQRLGPRPDGRQMSLPFEAYPEPLQRDVEAYLTAIGAPTAEPERPSLFGRRRTLSAATVATRRTGVRRLLWGAVQAGAPIETLTSLRTVVTPDFVCASLGWHWERKGGQSTADIGVLCDTVCAVAKHLGVARDDWAEVKALLDQARPPARTDMTPRNQRLIEALKEPDVRARLLHLPPHLLDEARRLRDGWTDAGGRHHPPRRKEAAWQAQLAVALELLLHTAMRMANLHALRLGDEVQLTEVRRNRWRGVVIGRHRKTGHGIHVPLNDDTVGLLREYLDGFRPLLGQANVPWLFPGDAGPDKPRHKSAFGRAMTDAVWQHVGIRMNPHAFRAFAGSLILEADPNAIEDLRALLGHSTYATALTYYRAHNTRAAAQRLSATLTSEKRRDRLAPLAVPLNLRAFGRAGVGGGR